MDIAALSEKKHHYLVTGSVIIEYDDQVQAIPANSTIVTDTKNLAVRQLAKAQQALQITVFNKLGELPTVRDVVLMNFTYLGLMTDEEFQLPPEGQSVKEVLKPSAEVIEIADRIFDGKVDG